MPRKRRSSKQTRSLLAVLQTQPRAWKHGYELTRETSLKAGTLYPILMRLSERGLLESKWQDSDLAGRPPRHLYRLTARGFAYAQEQMEEHSHSRPGLKLQGSRA
jgi:DNA-binding PadR family transcriptional regulator